MTVLDGRPDYLIEIDSAMTDKQVAVLREMWASVYRHGKPVVLSCWDYTHEPYPRLRALDA